MHLHASQQVHDLADLISQSGPDWRNDYQVADFVRRRIWSIGEGPPHQSAVTQVIHDVAFWIEMGGPQWLCDWKAVDEIDRLLPHGVLSGADDEAGMCPMCEGVFEPNEMCTWCCH